MRLRVGDWGYFKSGKDAPWDLGKSYHNAKFWVVNLMVDNNGRDCVCVQMATVDGKMLKRWTTVESLRYMVNVSSPYPEPLKKICRFDFKSGMNPKIYHSY